MFFNRRRDRVKLLVWERGGFWLLYKRLEAGTFAEVERSEISARELFLLLEGIEVVRERRALQTARGLNGRECDRLSWRQPRLVPSHR